jgi:hypothetical protein
MIEEIVVIVVTGIIVEMIEETVVAMKDVVNEEIEKVDLGKTSFF